MKSMIQAILFFRSKLVYLRTRNRIARWIENGLQLGEKVSIMSSVYIDDEYSYLISIGNNCSLSHNTRILAHDATTFKFIGEHTRVERVTILDNVYVGEDVTILPGCTIGPNALIATGSLVNKNVPPNSCIAGVPARIYARFEDYIEEQRKKLKSCHVVAYKDLIGPARTDIRKNLLLALDRDGRAYVKGFAGKFPYTFNGSDFRKRRVSL